MTSWKEKKIKRLKIKVSYEDAEKKREREREREREKKKKKMIMRRTAPRQCSSCMPLPMSFPFFVSVLL